MNEEEELELAKAELELASAAPVQAAAVGDSVAAISPGQEQLNKANGRLAPFVNPDLSPQGKAGTAVRAFGQGASFSQMPNLRGLTDAMGAAVNRYPQLTPIAAALNPVGMAGRGISQLASGFNDEESEADSQLGFMDLLKSKFRAGQRETNAENYASEAAHPYLYKGAEIAGNIASSAALPTGALGKAIGEPMAAGIIQGGLSRAGSSQYSPTQGEVGPYLKDIAGAGAMGGLVSGGLSMGARGLGKAAGAGLEAMSRSNALKSIGLYSGISNLGKRLGYETAEDLGELGAKARDSGMIKPFGTSSDVAASVEAELPKLGAQQAEVFRMVGLDAAEKGIPFDNLGMAGKMTEATVPSFGHNELSKRAAKMAEGYADDAAKLGADNIAESFPRANQFRQQLGSDIPWNAPAFGANSDLEIEMAKKAYGAAGDDIVSQVGKVGGDKMGAELAAVNKRIALMKDIQRLSQNDALKEFGRKGKGLSGVLGIVGGVAGMKGGMDPAMSLALGYGLNKAAQTLQSRGPSALTHLQHGVGEYLGKSTGDLPAFIGRTALANRDGEYAPPKRSEISNRTKSLLSPEAEAALAKPKDEREEESIELFLSQSP